ADRRACGPDDFHPGTNLNRAKCHDILQCKRWANTTSGVAFALRGRRDALGLERFRAAEDDPVEPLPEDVDRLEARVAEPLQLRLQRDHVADVVFIPRMLLR